MTTRAATPTLERLATPIGTAILVTDEHGNLRTFLLDRSRRALMAFIARHCPGSDAFVSCFGGGVDVREPVP